MMGRARAGRSAVVARSHAPLSLNLPSDNARGFFEACFPALLRNVFGLEGTAWLSAAARVS